MSKIYLKLFPCFFVSLLAAFSFHYGIGSAFAETLTMEHNTNYFGMDYNDGKLPRANCDAECCRDACRKDPRCKAYTWVKPGVQGPTARCWLKHGVPAKSVDHNTISGRKVASGHSPPPTVHSTTTMTMEHDTNYFGMDYNDGKLPRPKCGPECCRDACRKDPRCKAYTWVKPGVQGPTARCWLKHGVPAKSRDYNTISGRKVASGHSPPPTVHSTTTMTMEHDTNYFGMDYNDGKLPRANCDAECCRDACRKDPRCKAYTWVKPGVQGPTARCWLKHGVPAKSRDYNTISGRKVMSQP
jgi:hypothetical protein